MDYDIIVAQGSRWGSDSESDFRVSQHRIWIVGTYDIVVMLRYCVSRYRVFADLHDIVGSCYDIGIHYIVATMMSQAGTLNYNMPSMHRVCYDIVGHNYDVVDRTLRCSSPHRVLRLYCSHGSAMTSQYHHDTYYDIVGQSTLVSTTTQCTYLVVYILYNIVHDIGYDKLITPASLAQSIIVPCSCNYLCLTLHVSCCLQVASCTILQSRLL